MTQHRGSISRTVQAVEQCFAASGLGMLQPRDLITTHKRTAPLLCRIGPRGEAHQHGNASWQTAKKQQGGGLSQRAAGLLRRTRAGELLAIGCVRHGAFQRAGGGPSMRPINVDVSTNIERRRKRTTQAQTIGDK